MRKYLVLGLLLGGVTPFAHAQSKSADQLEYEALLKENAALKATLAQQQKAVAIGPNNEQVVVEFISCTASKRTKLATLTFRLQDQAPISAPVSLKGFPPMVARLKELNFAFLRDMGDGLPARKFNASLRNVPIIWKP